MNWRAWLSQYAVKVKRYNVVRGGGGGGGVVVDPRNVVHALSISPCQYFIREGMQSSALRITLKSTTLVHVRSKFA